MGSRDSPQLVPGQREAVEVASHDRPCALYQAPLEGVEGGRERPWVDVVEADRDTSAYDCGHEIEARVGREGDRVTSLGRHRDYKLKGLRSAACERDMLGIEPPAQCKLQRLTTCLPPEHSRGRNRTETDRRVHGRQMAWHELQGSERLMRGPITFVTPTGSLRHALVASWNFGLSGLGVDTTPVGDHCSQGRG